jgi:pyridoxamine 5'-phosphate oxidase family protein
VEFISFKTYEVEFMKAAELGRLATIQRDGTPQVSPVGFTYNEELGTIDISGYNMAKSQKFRNVAHHDEAAFVVDDIASRDPWRARCLEIRGTAKQVVAAQGEPSAAGMPSNRRSSASPHTASSASASTTPPPSRAS